MIIHHNPRRATYDLEVRGDLILLVDLCIGRSITNDAEHVIEDLRQRCDLSRCRVILYRDTRGIWDRLLIDQHGRFGGFCTLNERSLEAAIARVKFMPPTL